MTDNWTRMRLARGRFLAVAFVALLTVTASSAILWAATIETSARQEKLVAGARMLDAYADYRAFCLQCHGESGEGVGGIIDFTSTAALTKLDRTAIEEAIESGHEPAIVALWGTVLTNDRRTAVVDYIRDAFMLPTPDADASIGRQIYAETCSVCHGERGDAASWAKNSLDPPPFDFTSEKALKLSRAHMLHTVIYGSPGTAMMPFATQYSRGELAAVIDYIRSAFMRIEQHQLAAAEGRDSHQGHAHGAAIDPSFDAPFPGGLVGHADIGRDLYVDNCADCHGKLGDGEGRRAYFMRRKPRDFTTAEARKDLNRPHLFLSIAKGVLKTEMPAWSKVMEAQQIADIAEYVFVAFIDSGGGAAEPKNGAAEHGHNLGHEHESHGAPDPADEDKHGQDDSHDHAHGDSGHEAKKKP